MRNTKQTIAFFLALIFTVTIAVTNAMTVAVEASGGTMTEETREDKTGPAKAESAKTPGIHKLVFTMKDGTRVRYTLALPKTTGSGTPVPFVIALHYGGPVSAWYSSGYLTALPEPALRDLGAIIAAPDCPTHGWINDKAEKTVLELMNFIETEYPVDRKRVVITGFSMGGIGTWHMVARHPERFSAAVPVSALTGPGDIDMVIKNKVPLYVIHSKKDEIFPIAKAKAMIKKLQDAGRQVEFIALDDISHYHTGAFVDALKDAVPWIKKVWKEGKRN